jgi:hypothetical protein
LQRQGLEELMQAVMGRIETLDRERGTEDENEQAASR